MSEQKPPYGKQSAGRKVFVSLSVTSRPIAGIVVIEPNGEQVMLTAPSGLAGLLLCFTTPQAAAAWAPGAAVMEMEPGMAARKELVN